MGGSSYFIVKVIQACPPFLLSEQVRGFQRAIPKTGMFTGCNLHIDSSISSVKQYRMKKQPTPTLPS